MEATSPILINFVVKKKEVIWKDFVALMCIKIASLCASSKKTEKRLKKFSGH